MIINHWTTLHSNEKTDIKFNQLCIILSSLKNDLNCDCQPTANEFLFEMLNLYSVKNKTNKFEDVQLLKENFLHLNNTSFFFFHYHNLINLKLFKPIYPLKKLES
jgi:hypothetical protein